TTLILEAEADNLGFSTLQASTTDIFAETPAEEVPELLQLVVGSLYLVPREQILLSVDFSYNVFHILPDVG
ncbi:hypothetical protein F442_22949, partial [Phytophthora nicotianae P10297]